jgi:hypothetical protein
MTSEKTCGYKRIDDNKKYEENLDELAAILFTNCPGNRLPQAVKDKFEESARNREPMCGDAAFHYIKEGLREAFPQNICSRPAHDVIDKLREIFIDKSSTGFCYPSISDSMDNLDHCCDNEYCMICVFDEAVRELRQQQEEQG